MSHFSYHYMVNVVLWLIYKAVIVYVDYEAMSPSSLETRITHAQHVVLQLNNHEKYRFLANICT